MISNIPTRSLRRLMVAAVISSSLCPILLKGQVATFGDNGDLILGFRATGGTGANKSLVIDLGSYSSIAATGGFTLDFSSAGSVLASTFGTNWASRNDLYWGTIGSDANTVDLWLSRMTGFAYPAGSDGSSPPIRTDELAIINQNVGNMQVASAAGNATQTTIIDSSGISHAISVYPTSNSGSWQFYASTGFGYFPGSTDILVSYGQTVAYYTSDWADTFAGVSPVDLFNLRNSNGVLSLIPVAAPTPAPTPSPTPSSYAGPWNWTNGAGNWSASNNWTSNQVASNGVAVGITGAAGGTITNDAVTNISSLTFSNGAGAYTITGTNASQSLAVTAGITNSSSATQTIGLSITGTGGVTQSGSGTLVMSRSNSYGGGTTLSGGAVVIGNDNALGSGTVTVSGAASLIAGTNNLSTTNEMTLNASATLDTAGSRWTNAGTLSGTGSLIKAGNGTLTFAGSGSAFGGDTAVNAGTLQVAAGSSLGSGTVTVASGAGLSGAGTIGGVVLRNGGTLAAGIDGAIGRLTVAGGMTLSAGSVLNWKLGDANGIAGTGFDSFSVGGLLDLSGLGTGSTLRFNILNASGGTANFLNSQNTQWLVLSAGSIAGFSTNDFTISVAGFTNALGGGAFGFITNATGLYLKFTALGIDPWTGNIAAGSNVISGLTVTSTNSAVIGANSSRNGSVSVTGNGVWTVNGSLQVGGSSNGSGTLSIGSGGRVTANGLSISDQRGSKGLVLIANGASPAPISLGSGTLGFGAGNGTLQFAQSNAVMLSNAVSGKGRILSTGTGTTTLSGNQSGFNGTNQISSGKVVLGPGVTNGGLLNVAGRGTNVVFAMNTGSVLSSTGTHAVAGLLLDNSGLSFNDSIKGQVVLSSTGVLQKTYVSGSSVSGFGAGIGAGKSFAILAGTAASDGTGTTTLQAKLVNGALDFKGTFSNAAVLAVKDPSYSAIRNTIRWYDTNTSSWQNTVAGNTDNVSPSSISSMLGGNSRLWSATTGFRGSFSTFLLDARGETIAAQKGVSLSSLTASNILGIFNSLSESLINQDLAAIMGAFGYDSATRTAWAVINHNSLFTSGGGRNSADIASAAANDSPVSADLSVFGQSPTSLVPGVQAVPEPGTCGLIMSGALVLAIVLARRRFRSE